MKIINYTHADLDGVLCSLSLQRYYGNDNVDIVYCGYNTVNEYIMKLLTTDEHEKYDLVYITDISVSIETAIFIEENMKDKVILIDHHTNSNTEHLKKYDWVTLQENDPDDGLKTSACMMVYKYFYNKIVESAIPDKDGYFDNEFENSNLLHIIELGRDYDTWVWKDKDNIMAKNLNTLCTMLGFERFLGECRHQIFMFDEYFCSFGIDPHLQLLLDLQEEDVERCLKSAEKNLYVKTYDDLKIGVYYGSDHVNEVCNLLCENHPELDAIMCINMKTGASIRTNRNDIHVGELSKKIGAPHNINGGGHAKASGISLTNEFKEKFIDLLLGKGE